MFDFLGCEPKFEMFEVRSVKVCLVRSSFSESLPCTQFGIFRLVTWVIVTLKIVFVLLKTQNTFQFSN